MIGSPSLASSQAEARPRARNRRDGVAGLALVTLGFLPACEPELSVGEWACSDNGPALSKPTDAIEVPWSTGFENHFCDYSELAGFCYAAPGASYRTVTSPVHAGHYAAAFTVTGDDPDAFQTRCVRQGSLPAAAYYGAWYFVPALATNSELWNLVHFQGGDISAQHGLWDISLVNGANGDLEAVVFDFLNTVVRRPTAPTPIPIGSWFQLELYLERASDATGEVALYQDGQLLFDATNLITDDSSFAQWYVGNLATGLSPADSTLYVDDVTIRGSR
ncbi:MAG TPA: hypothetical protein VGP93_03465 [Polyangiaceae bacterium]|nr:hypothetical protein [Polyangiaceae bacterium]